MVKSQKILLLLLLLCAGSFVSSCRATWKEDSAERVAGRWKYDTVFLVDGTMLISMGDAFITHSCEGISGNIEDGSRYEIIYGIIEKLFLLSNGKQYRIYAKTDVLKAIENSIRNGNIEYHAEDGLFYHARQEGLFEGLLVGNYKTLDSTVYPERTQIHFRHGKAWKIEEFDKNLTANCSFDMDEIIFLHTYSRRLTKCYIDSNKEYFGAGSPPFVTNQKIPYQEETGRDLNCSEVP